MLLRQLVPAETAFRLPVATGQTQADDVAGGPCNRRHPAGVVPLIIDVGAGGEVHRIGRLEFAESSLEYIIVLVVGLVSRPGQRRDPEGVAIDQALEDLVRQLVDDAKLSPAPLFMGARQQWVAQRKSEELCLKRLDLAANV